MRFPAGFLSRFAPSECQPILRPESLTMNGDLPFALVAFTAVFFVVDPFAVIPLFLTMTQGDPPEKKHRMALKASIATTLTLLIFASAGTYILGLFAISLGAFRIAGGILLFLVGLDMLRAQKSRTRTSPEEETEGAQSDDVAIIPLAIPMLSGPGSIATVMVMMSEAGAAWDRILIVVGSILATGLLTFVLLRSAGMLEGVLKQTGLNIVNRVMGLILAAMAVQITVAGLRDVMPEILSKT
jgi:multiple antibiotic resistance protein